MSAQPRVLSSAHLACAVPSQRGCKVELPLSTTQVACPACGGLLTVVHDMSALTQLSGAAWRERFDIRLRANTPIDAARSTLETILQQAPGATNPANPPASPPPLAGTPG